MRAGGEVATDRAAHGQFDSSSKASPFQRTCVFSAPGLGDQRAKLTTYFHGHQSGQDSEFFACAAMSATIFARTDF